MARPSVLFNRHIMPALEAALADTPVVLAVGPRQAGKTTLCRLVADRRGSSVRYRPLGAAGECPLAAGREAGEEAAMNGHAGALRYAGTHMSVQCQGTDQHVAIVA